MSREIKFRAKRLDNNQWVIGYYLPTQYGEKHFIYFALEFLNEHTRIEIDPKTLGQFTGLKDKNGKEIYEGDVCNAQYNICDFYKKVPVYFCSGCFYVDDKSPAGNLPLNYFFNSNKEIEVIGNIYKNPELITGGKND